MSGRHLIDFLHGQLNTVTDRELADMLQVTPPEVSRVRNNRRRIPSGFLLRALRTVDVDIHKLDKQLQRKESDA